MTDANDIASGNDRLAAMLINGPGWPVTFNADGMASVHNCDFARDPRFQRAYTNPLKESPIHGYQSR